MAKTELPVDRILVSLDSLVDTRLGTIFDIDPKFGATRLNKFYYERSIDEFTGIDPQVFKDRYAKRDVDTLQRSLVTHVPLLLQALIKGAANEVLRAGPQSRMVFSINTHPYDLSEEEKAEILAALEISVGDSAEYECVKIPLEFLTPEYCKSQYAAMVMYEFADWMVMHAEAFKEVRMRNVVIYAPMLLRVKPSDQELREMSEKSIDPFDSARIAASPAFELRFLTTDVFCMRDAARDVKMVQMYYSDTKNVDELIQKGEAELASEPPEEKSTLTPEEAAQLLQELCEKESEQSSDKQ